MKFAYKKIAPGVERPVIPVVVANKSQSVPYYALIDSGADLSIFHAEIADLLGIDLEQGRRQEVSGVVEGERRPYYVHNVTIKVGGWEYKDVPIGFMPDLAKLGYGVLGQRGFFNLFVVKFTFSKSEIELRDQAGR